MDGDRSPETASTGTGIALRAAALVGPDRSPIEQLREAPIALEASPAGLEHSRVLVGLGAAMR